jgi:hypothetical protein
MGSGLAILVPVLGAGWLPVVTPILKTNKNLKYNKFVEKVDS